MIELFGLLQNQEALMNSCFLELLREEVGRFYVDLLQIEGGMDLLPRAFLPALASRIRFGARMTTIEPARGRRDDPLPDDRRACAASAGDYAIVTVPFPVLRHVEVTHPFSSAKRRAIRQLRYDASAKIFLQFRRRFWEEDEGIVGGGTVTDLPIRNVFYPEHGRELGRGVMLASYTWSEDAQRWGSLGDDERLAQALENLAVIHPQALARVRGRRVEDVARRPECRRRVRAVRARPADAAARPHRGAGGPRVLRRRARVARARLDPGRDRIGPERGGGDPRTNVLASS